MKTRRRNFPKIQAASAVLLALFAAQTAAAQMDPRRDAAVAAVAKALPAVVNIATERLVEIRDPLEEFFDRFWGPYYRRRPPAAEYSLGSGVVVDEQGYILTNDHVVRRASKISVRLAQDPDGKSYEADLIARSAEADIALIKLRSKPEESFHTIPFAKDDDLLLGEAVLALGNPFGLGGTVTRGILSSKSRRPPVEGAPMGIEDWLQTDAAINPGNSGGPLINLKGELIGVNVAVFENAQGIGFAIPIKRVADALSEIFTPETLGWWFGGRIRQNGAELTVTAVEPGSPAAKAGLQQGDRIVAVNGAPAGELIRFVRLLVGAGASRAAKIGVLRKGRSLQLQARLLPASHVFNAETFRKRTGILLEEPRGRGLRRAGTDVPEGLLIAEVDPGSPAAEAGLRPGFVLLAVEGEPARSAAEAARRIHLKPSGKTIRLDVLIRFRRGAIMFQQQRTVELRLR